MALLKQIMLDAIKNSAEQATKLINDFDWEKTKDELAERGDQFVKFGNSFIDDVKESLGMVKAEMNNMPHFKKVKDGNVVLTVPYSKEDGDKLKWKVDEAGMLVINIERISDSYDNKRTYRNSIPEGYVREPLSISANREAKVVNFVFEKDEEDEFEEMD